MKLAASEDSTAAILLRDTCKSLYKRKGKDRGTILK